MTWVIPWSSTSLVTDRRSEASTRAPRNRGSAAAAFSALAWSWSATTMRSKKSRREAIEANAPPTPPAPTSRILTGRSLPDVGHDVLDARVVLEAVHRQVLAVAGLLEAAVRHLR